MAGYKKILVLLDLTDASEQIAAAGRDMAAYSNAAMVMLHVVEFVPADLRQLLRLRTRRGTDGYAIDRQYLHHHLPLLPRIPQIEVIPHAS